MHSAIVEGSWVRLSSTQAEHQRKHCKHSSMQRSTVGLDAVVVAIGISFRICTPAGLERFHELDQVLPFLRGQSEVEVLVIVLDDLVQCLEPPIVVEATALAAP